MNPAVRLHGLPHGFRSISIPRRNLSLPVAAPPQQRSIATTILIHNSHQHPKSSPQRQPQRQTAPLLLATQISRPVGGPRNNRHNVLLPSSRRTFIEPALQASHTVITSLHAFCPWWLTIPIFSLLVSMTFRFPLQLYSKRVVNRALRLRPLAASHIAAVVSMHGSKDPRILTVEKEHNRVFALVKKKFLKTHKIQPWRYRLVPLAAFPGWLLGGEAIRRVAGGHVGILGMISGASGDEHIKYLADPTMATEGLLWMTNLAVTDPYHVLPIILGAVMLYRTAPRTIVEWQYLLSVRRVAREESRAEVLSRPSLFMQVIRRYFVLFSVLLPWLVWDMEAALQLYWLSTLGWSMLGQLAIDRFFTSPYALWAKRLPGGSARRNTTSNYIRARQR